MTTKSAVKPAENPNLKVYIVDNVATLMDTLKPLVKTHQVLIHSMAVSDYTPVYMTDLCEVEKSDNIAQLLTKKILKIRFLQNLTIKCCSLKNA